jgi:hypothetical protein
MNDGGAVLLVLVLLLVMAILHLLKKRRTPLSGADVALKTGLAYSAKRTREIQPRLKFINRLQYGTDHYAFNVFSGKYKGHQVKAFDFHYLVETVAGKGGNGTIEDPYCFYILELPSSFPEVTIYKEGLISKLKQLAGANDIDFESHEFSRMFRVRSPDPKCAYDFCNARMIEYLLANTDLSVEVDRNILCVSFDKPLEFEEVEQNLNRLVEIRSLMPDYLFSKYP